MLHLSRENHLGWKWF